MGKQFMLVILIFLFLLRCVLLRCYNSQLLPVAGTHNNMMQTYIVHVGAPESREFFNTKDLKHWHNSFLPSTHLDSGEARLIYSYNHAISGFAALLKPQEVKAMEAKNGFLQAEVDQELELQTTYTPYFLELNQRRGMWWQSDYGAGAIIGVIDSGIDPFHVSFSDKGMPPPPRRWRGRCDFNASACNNKLIGARAFRGGSVRSPFDDHGHGTHTASTIAGSEAPHAEILGQAPGTAIGMASKAHLAIYKVFWQNYAYESDMLAALDQAIEDGVDVILLSLGRPSKQLSSSNVAIGSLAAMEKGILTCAAAGNSGPYPSVISNDAPWLLTVGASTTDRRITTTVRLGNGMEVDGESVYQPRSYDTTPAPLAYPGKDGELALQQCKPNTFSSMNIKGKIVMCWVSEDSNVEKGIAVRRAGGAGMILMNGPLQSLTTPAEVHVLPVAHLSHKGALKVLSYFACSPTTPMAAIIPKGTQFRARPTPTVASFSSRGPSLTNGGIAKPDVVAPGVNVLAAWPLKAVPSLGGSSSAFNFMSGTSVAAAHLSGVAAMLKSIHPDWSPAMIKSAIMTTAYALDFDEHRITDGYPDTGPPSSSFAMGAGHVNPSGAQDPGFVYDIQPSDYINYLCGLGLADEQVSVVVRRKIKCSNVEKMSAEELNYPSISLQLEFDKNKTITRTVTNVAGEHEVYFLHVDEPEGVAVQVSPHRIHFTRMNQKKSFTIEFGIMEDYPRVRGMVNQGELTWASHKHVVRSSMSITFV